jgi:ubiquinone/menaquinone biosynthesis C-methylase UbiE
MSSDPAFSAVASDYDATFTETAVGRLQRELVWKLLEKHVQGVPNVLELNCGTGADAVWMGKRGWQVLATDISPEMLRVAHEKIEKERLTDKVSVQVCAFAELQSLPSGHFDLIFSNFGGLNCISPKELAQLWPVLRSKLKPGGQIAAVIMGKFCLWETLYFLLKLKPKEAFRRLGTSPVEARLDAQSAVKTWYHPPPQPSVSGLAHTQAYPIGFWLPPSYLDPFFSRHPKALRLLNFLERYCCPRWLAWGSDHYLLLGNA